VLQLAEKLEIETIYSEIVQINNPAVKPPSGPNGFRPLTLSMPVTPSDTEDLSSKAKRFLKYLHSIWARRNNERK
jgi:hypothetical protein